MTRTAELLRKGAPVRSQDDARDLMSANMGSDPFEKIEELREIGARKARAEGVAYQMEHERKIVLATLASEYASMHARENLSEAKLDRLARADHRYQKHIAGLAQAVEDREMCRSEYWAVKSELLWQEKVVSHLNAVSRLDGTP